jgi:ribonuclease P protein component
VTTRSGATGPRDSARSSRRRLRTLKHAWQFRHCYNSGRKLVTPHSVIFLCAPSGPDGVRVGVVASRRVGEAVRRNRAKRLLREAARRLVPRVTERSLWLVLVAKASIATKTSAEVGRDLERALLAERVIGPEIE